MGQGGAGCRVWGGGGGCRGRGRDCVKEWGLLSGRGKGCIWVLFISRVWDSSDSGYTSDAAFSTLRERENKGWQRLQRRQNVHRFVSGSSVSKWERLREEREAERKTVDTHKHIHILS